MQGGRCEGGDVKARSESQSGGEAGEVPFEGFGCFLRQLEMPRVMHPFNACIYAHDDDDDDDDADDEANPKVLCGCVGQSTG